MRRRLRNRCRVCDSAELPAGAHVCAVCGEYGVWWDQVARRPAMEVTGEVGVPELRLLVLRNEAHVRLWLNPAETSHRHPDPLPTVTEVNDDSAGISFTYVGRNGNSGHLWRPTRMPTSVVVNGQALRVAKE